MSKIKDKAAREKIIRARTNLLVSNGFFGFLAMQLILVEDYDQPTGWVDGVHMGYNPNFVNQLDDRETEFLVGHEVMHCCLKHFSRRGNRDPVAWNIAGDFVINLELQEAGFKLIHNRQINGKNFQCCVDSKYKGMNTEEIYESFPVQYVSLMSDDGNGKPWNVGGVKDAPGDKGQQDEAAQKWESSVRAAIAIAKANDDVGKLPGLLQRLANELNKPKVSWRDRTRNFIDQSMSKEPSWSRINRRSAATNVLMPGLISDRLSQLIFVVDTSGSINQKLFISFLSECAGALDEGATDRMTVLYADTRVHDVDEYVNGDIVVPRKLDKGGGGTAFSDSFRWIKENAPDASCVIYLTDLQVYDFGEDPGIPTLWAVYSPVSQFDQLASKAPFGNAIHVGDAYG